jgi:hypothetical protein
MRDSGVSKLDDSLSQAIAAVHRIILTTFWIMVINCLEPHLSESGYHQYRQNSEASVATNSSSM